MTSEPDAAALLAQALGTVPTPSTPDVEATAGGPEATPAVVTDDAVPLR